MAAIPSSLDSPALLHHSNPPGLFERDPPFSVRYPLSSLASLHHRSSIGSFRKKLGLDYISKPDFRVFAAGVSAADSETSLDSDVGCSYQRLRDLLAAGEWQLADEETRRLVLVLAGENAVKRTYVFFSEVQFIPVTDLSTIDGLWRTFSRGKFGYSVQRKIWKRLDKDFTAFFKKVRWMKPLASDSPQFTYRAFPSEFMWELDGSTPEGHLPLTNALRGTQLLRSLLTHPAFDFADEDLVAPSTSPSLSEPSNLGSDISRTQAPKSVTSLPADYSF